MGSGILQPTHLIFILLLAVLLFGAKRLPEIGRGLGKGMREFKDSVSGLTEVTDAVHSTPAPAPPLQPAATPASVAAAPPVPQAVPAPVVAAPAPVAETVEVVEAPATAPADTSSES